MPFRSQAQRAWMHIHHPEMAKRWEKHTPKGKLPQHVSKEEIGTGQDIPVVGETEDLSTAQQVPTVVGPNEAVGKSGADDYCDACGEEIATHETEDGNILCDTCYKGVMGEAADPGEGGNCHQCKRGEESLEDDDVDAGEVDQGVEKEANTPMVTKDSEMSESLDYIDDVLRHYGFNWTKHDMAGDRVWYGPKGFCVITTDEMDSLAWRIYLPGNSKTPIRGDGATALNDWLKKMNVKESAGEDLRMKLYASQITEDVKEY